ncbi:MAG: hypothetical protein RLZZ400_168 [Actinomycetota bacterium]|jgi:uncharacterized membrane protein YoaK (UPF0700 family)
MIEPLYLALLWVSVGLGLFNLGLGLFRRKPSLLSMGATAVVELGLLVQLVASISVLISGQTSKGSLGEFFGYILVALLVPVGAILWSLVERTVQSTLILGIAPLVIAVMLYRMMTIWSGQ